MLAACPACADKSPFLGILDYVSRRQHLTTEIIHSVQYVTANLSGVLVVAMMLHSGCFVDQLTQRPARQGWIACARSGYIGEVAPAPLKGNEAEASQFVVFEGFKQHVQGFADIVRTGFIG